MAYQVISIELYMLLKTRERVITASAGIRPWKPFCLRAFINIHAVKFALFRAETLEAESASGGRGIRAC